MLTSHQYRLTARPTGTPKPTDWTFGEEPMGDPNDGEVLIKILYVSLDPAMRDWVRQGRSYLPPVALGEVMRARAAGRVIASRNAKFSIDDHVIGSLGVQEYALSNGEGLRTLDLTLAPLPVHLSVLGMTGLSAYFGLLDIGRPRQGETVLVSAAAGAVGMVAGQIAKIKGCRAVGIAGGAEKCRWIVDHLGFDAAIDYKSEHVRHAIKKHCPGGVNVYFDNVGGETLEAALANIARGARIVLCGAISQYNNTGPTKGPSNYMALLVHRARMEGFVVIDYADRYEAAIQEMAGWMVAGQLKSREHIVDGLETFPQSLLKLFSGENIGKLMIRVATS